MIETKKFLTPIEPDLPSPKHTQLLPRCFICKHFPVCNIREDYLKTAQLIEKVLGAPCESYELYPTPIPVPEFIGTIIEDVEAYFPTTVLSTKDKEGSFYVAKYTDSKNIQFMYIFDGYYVLFSAIYNEETNKFDISVGKEICYNIECNLSESSLDDLQRGLLSFKEDLEKQKPTEEVDIINTTYFSAALNCQFYEWEKGLDYYEGVRRIIAKYPCGVPLADGKYYHLATFHKENGCVPCYHPENGQPAFAPMPYPVYILSPCKKQKPPTRDELNEF